MSKSSTTSTNKSLPAKSAWSKGPPQTSAPSPRSQSPAPSAQSQPHLTHSRRPSALGQGIPIKDGVSIPRNNVGAAAAKPGSAVTFGSIDDASAPISSSPAAPPPTLKETIVKSFGTVPAASSNGKLSRPAVSTGLASTPSTSASATPTTTAPPAKPDKKDIAKLFQTSTAPAPSQAEAQSPSLRNASISSQNQQPPQPSGSQPSQFTPHFQPFVPSGSRPQPQNAGPNSGPTRSPVYSRQMPNGTGPRPPAPPNGVPSTGMSSPRLAPPHVAQPPGPPPTAPPVPGQPHMPPPMVWNGYYPYPPQEYVPYPPWGYMGGMPPQPGHPHPPPPPHMGAPPAHMPQHPMSPHTPTRNLQPSTPTMSHAHAGPSPAHPPHPPPPLAHPPNNMANISSPPPTPSSTLSGARLNPGSSTFIPQQRTPSKITLKNPDGKEVALESLTKTATAGSAASSGQGTPFRQPSPGTPKRASIRMETEDQKRKRLAEEEAREKEKQKAQQEAEEKAKKEKEEEERKKKEAEEKEKERVRLEEEKKEKERLREEEEKRKKQEEEERAKREAEEQERLKREEEERKKKEEEERVRKEAEEAEKQRLQKEEQERKAKEEEERKAKEEEERKQKEAAEEKARQEAASKAEAPAAPEEGEITESPATKDEAKDKVKEQLRINTVTSNPADLGKRRPANLDLSAVRSAPVASALATARNLETLEGIKYPEGIQSPKPELNENAKPGRFRYDRDFLLQFREICKDKPPNLPPLDAIGLEPIDQAALMMSRGGSGRHRGASSAAPSRQSSIGIPFGAPSNLGKSASGFSMGNFGTPARGLSSDERFAMSNGNRSTSVSTAAGLPFPRPAGIQRTASHGGQIRERTRSKRGEKRPPAEGKGHQQDRNMTLQQQQQMLEPVAPLQVSENRWDRKAINVDQDSPEMVDRKVKGLLNKLTMEKFTSISDQIIAWANKSEKEKDGRTLIQVIRLVFEKATDEATWSEMYARLCRKMMEQISPKVQDDGIKNAEGKPIAGGQLFRKYLLNRCQEDFERGWVQKEATAAAAKAKAADDEAVKAANTANEEAVAKGEKKDDGEIALYSDEYYAAQKAKRQGLGLIKFIGELFKLQMLTERIMHECVKKLLGNVDNPEEEEIESLCKLLTTVGALLDTPKAHAHMDIYFSRMKELTKSPNVSPRMQFMLQDVIELRERKWVSRLAVAAPTTLAQVHENAAKEKAAQEKENMQRQISSMSRTSSNRGRNRNDEPDGWAVAGSNARPVSTKAGDLSNFGKISKTQPMQTFGPSSVFSKKNDKRESLSRSSSSSNMFSMLQNAEAAPDKAEPVQRKKLVLAPRSVPKPDNTNAAAAGPAESEDGHGEEEERSAAPEMSDADAKKKIDEDSKELFGVRNLDEAEVYFTALPSQYHHKLVDKLVTKAVESKAADAELVASLFERASSKNLCAASAFEEGFSLIVEFLDDIAIDAPHAFSHFVKMVKGANLSAEAHKRLAEKDGSDKLLPLLS